MLESISPTLSGSTKHVDALWTARLLKEEKLLTGWRVGAGGMAGNLFKGEV